MLGACAPGGATATPSQQASGRADAPAATDGPAPAVPSPSAAAPLHVVGVGDSVMAGAHCDCDGIPDEYAVTLSRRIDRTVSATNLGVSGDTTSDLLDLVRHDKKTRQQIRDSDVVLVIIGANDLIPQWREWSASSCDDTCYNPAIKTMSSQLDDILAEIDDLHPDRQSVLVANYWNVFTDGDVARSDGGQEQIDWSNDVTVAANKAILQAADAHGATPVDVDEPFQTASGGDPTQLLADDGDHPNAAGVKVIVNAFDAAWTP